MSSPTRQLAAIMFTDIVGYTAMMGKNANKALEVLQVNKSIQKPLVEKHSGKWLKEMGDGVLASFGSALDAVNCAIEIQDLARLRLDIPLRIGIHLGDVTVEENDVHGDGVNIASRLESICDPGGIYISDSIQKAIRGSGIQTVDMGDKELKNVDYWVRTFAVQGPGLPEPPVQTTYNSGGKRSRFIWAFIIIFIAVVGGFSFFFYSKDFVSNSKKTFTEKSIAVLPFANLSNYDDQEYFCDGIMEEVLNQLVKINDLKVISRTTMMRYKGTDKSIAEIAGELNATTVLEGSVRRSGDQLRITVQLIEGTTDVHLWSETYERTIADIFSIQSDVAKSIAAALKLELGSETQLSIDRKPTSSTIAYDYYLKGLQFRATWRKELEIVRNADNALQMFKNAVSHDSAFAQAYVGIASVHRQFLYYNYHETVDHITIFWQALNKAKSVNAVLTEALLEEGLFEYQINRNYLKALNLFNTAEQIAPGNPVIYDNKGLIYRRQGLWEQSIANYEKARTLSPGDFDINFSYAETLVYSRNFNEAEKIFLEALSFEPENIPLRQRLIDLRVRAYGQIPDPEDDPVSSFYFNRDWKKLEELVNVHNISLNTSAYYTPRDLLLGQIAEQTGRDSIADQQAKKVINDLNKRMLMDPSDDRYYVAMSEAFAILNMMDSTVFFAENAVRLRPYEQDVLIGYRRVSDLAIAYIRSGKFKAAVQQLKWLLENSGEKPITRELLKIDPVYDGIRTYPPFVQLVNGVNP